DRQAGGRAAGRVAQRRVLCRQHAGQGVLRPRRGPGQGDAGAGGDRWQGRGHDRRAQGAAEGAEERPRPARPRLRPADAAETAGEVTRPLPARGFSQSRERRTELTLFMAEVLPWQNSPDPRAVLARAVAVLSEGRRVAFPTEATYVLAA